jgi:hypothetical protein
MVVDEVPMSNIEPYVISSLRLLMRNDSNNVHVITSALSPEQLKSSDFGSQPFYQILFPPLSDTAVTRSVNNLPEKERGLLQQDSFQSLLQDCAGYRDLLSMFVA